MTEQNRVLPCILYSYTYFTRASAHYLLLMLTLPLLAAVTAPAENINETTTTVTDPTVSHVADMAFEGTDHLAKFLMSIVNWLLKFFGLEQQETIVTIIYAAVVFGVAIGIGYIAKWIILGIVNYFADHTKNDVFHALRHNDFFTKLLRMVPALVFLALIQVTLTTHHSFLAMILTKITLLYVLFVTALALCAFVNGMWEHIDTYANKRRLPLNGLAQLVKSIIWIIVIIIAIAVIVNKSPGALLAGLGAFAAVLMLIFKDSILGLVAGVELSENDSLHVGDWIKVNGTDANGTVLEVSLNTVKVLNWDKTTTSIPPYNLITGSFTNYRSMQQSNTRQIQRSYNIDCDSVLPTTPQMLENIKSSVPFMDKYITAKLRQKAEGKVADVDNPEGLVDGTIDTNLGLFRAYMKMWLDANPHISHDSDCFVSTLPQTPTGIPFQVYCFTNTSSWFAYEAIKDTIFEHIAAMLPSFQLYAFENASGRDNIINGYISPGANIDEVFGVPYPFFQDPNAPRSPLSTYPHTVAPKLASTDNYPQKTSQNTASQSTDSQSAAPQSATPQNTTPENTAPQTSGK